jgi:hypothetical protein
MAKKLLKVVTTKINVIILGNSVHLANNFKISPLSSFLPTYRHIKLFKLNFEKKEV